jgi:hypothetical protein
MIIDEICEYLNTKLTNEWTGLDNVYELLVKRGMSHEEVEEVLDFLAKYFVEFDEKGSRVKLTTNFRSLYGSSPILIEES